MGDKRLLNRNCILERNNVLDKDIVFGHAAETSDHEFPEALKKIKG